MVKRTPRLVAFICFLSFALAFSQDGRSSFLLRPSQTTAQLVGEVLTTPAGRNQLQLHFHLEEVQLYSFLRTLKPVKLTEARTFVAYVVNSEGLLVPRPLRLKKGELVFVDLNGRPILRALGGNPLVDRGVYQPVLPAVGPNDEAPSIVKPDSNDPAISPLPMIAGGGKQDDQKESAPQIMPIPGGVSWLPLVGVPLVAGSFEGINSGGTHGVGPALPDPATFLVLGSGLLGFGLRRRKSTRSTRSSQDQGVHS